MENITILELGDYKPCNALMDTICIKLYEDKARTKLAYELYAGRDMDYVAEENGFRLHIPIPSKEYWGGLSYQR